MASNLTVTQIAEVCHEANRAYCRAIGDNSQLPWSEAPEWQRKSAISGVEFVKSNPDAPASANHDSWLAEKLKDGWIYGAVKDSDKKTHPCCVPYAELPIEQQAKDYLFRAVATSLL